MKKSKSSLTKKVMFLITKKVVDNKATGKGRFAVDVTKESFSIFEIFMTFRLILIKYIFIYVLLSLLTLFVLPGVVFHFTTFGLSVLTFFIGLSGIFYFTFNVVKGLPVMIKEEIVCRKNRITDSYNNNFKNEKENCDF